MAKVSVIVPVYNAERFIGETLRSVLCQTYKDIEVIVVDDGSTDHSVEVIKKYNDPRIMLIRQQNRGVSAARNTGIKSSNGKFIALLDHDDLWLAEKIEKQMILFEKNPDVALVYSDISYIDGEGKPVSWMLKQFEPHRGYVLRELFVSDFIPCLTAVFRKDVLEKIGLFNERYRYAEEYELFLRIARFFQFDFVDEVLACYRVHQSNLSRNIINSYLENIEILEHFYHTVPEVKNFEYTARKRIANMYFITGRRFQVEEKNRTEAIRMFRKSLIYNKISIKAMVGLLTACLNVPVPRRHRILKCFTPKNIFDAHEK
ncbi:MAG TPA: glycosyltransferase [bacterium]|nr:glycosyltransferase [bacterium]